MRQIRKWAQPIAAGLTSLAWSTLAFAQQQAPSVDVTTTTTRTTEVWYTNWWIWAAAVGVFLIVVIALTNRGSRSA
jgi:hypothetical protein